MKKPLMALAAWSILAAAPETARAQPSNAVSIAGGIAAPTGNLGDVAALGYNAALGLNLGGRRSPVGLRFEGAYSGLGLKNGNGDIRLIDATANAIVNMSATSDSPYVIGGLGYYNERIASGSGALHQESSRSAVGINLGAGLRFPLNGLSTFFETRYHVMFNDQSGGSNTQVIPITFGIMF